MWHEQSYRQLNRWHAGEPWKRGWHAEIGMAPSALSEDGFSGIQLHAIQANICPPIGSDEDKVPDMAGVQHWGKDALTRVPGVRD